MNSERFLSLLEARVSVPTWILLIQNMFIGLVLGLQSLLAPETIQILGATGWTFSLFVASIISIYGGARHSRVAIRIGSFIGVLAWSFAIISFALEGLLSINALVFGVPGVIFFVYVHLKFHSNYP